MERRRTEVIEYLVEASTDNTKASQTNSKAIMLLAVAVVLNAVASIFLLITKLG